MGLWIFMMIMNLLIPLTMVVFGKYFSEKAPENINAILGYRTVMSMKNKETWDFAHHYCGKLWVIIGRTTLLLSIIAMLILIGKGNNTVGKFGGIICGIQLVFLISPIYFTERALKKNFDKDGYKTK